ncbi:MAG: glycosyltransferase, partial [Chloroflexota bacterium]
MHDHGHGGEAGHGHGQRSKRLERIRALVGGHHHGTEEMVDGALASSARGIFALKVSLLGLGATALFQLVIAMASGSAIVASDVPGFREFIADGKTGLLTRVGDPGDLASKLRWIYDNPGDAEGLGANARRLAEERFDLSATARAHVNIYRDVIR